MAGGKASTIFNLKYLSVVLKTFHPYPPEILVKPINDRRRRFLGGSFLGFRINTDQRTPTFDSGYVQF